jgi:hypothetical protein
MAEHIEKPCKILFKERRSTDLIERLLRDETVECRWISRFSDEGKQTVILKLPNNKLYYDTRAMLDFGLYDPIERARGLAPIRRAGEYFGNGASSMFNLDLFDTILIWEMKDLEFLES